MRRWLVSCSTIVLMLVLVPEASATKPIREINPSQSDDVITGQCSFPVRAHVDGGEIITTFVDKAGEPVKQIGTFPGNTVTFTNLDSDISITVVATGPFHARVEPDGSGSVMITGHGPFIPNPITGEPGIWYLSGRARATFDDEGNVTSANVSGRLVDLCSRLAS